MGTNLPQPNNQNDVNKDWFMRHKWFFAVITLVILGAGLIVQLKIEYWRKNFTVDLPKHVENKRAVNEPIPENWLTVNYPRYGLTFRYPPGWQVKNWGEGFNIENEGVNIDLSEGKFGNQEEELYQHLIMQTSKLFNITPSKLGNIDALLINEYENQSTYFIYPPGYARNPNFDYIQISYAGSTSQDAQIIQQVLSTFDFSKRIPADWKVYFNDDYGIGFYYPRYYEIQETEKEHELNLRIGDKRRSDSEWLVFEMDVFMDMKSLDQWKKDIFDPESIVSSSALGDGIYVQTSDLPGHYYLTQKPYKAVLISSGDSFIGSELFTQIVSTIKSYSIWEE